MVKFYIAYKNLKTNTYHIIYDLGEFDKKPKKSDLPFDTKIKKHFILKTKVV